MKHLFTILILATCIQYSNSQTVPSFENPTPETASFQKYTHIPVAHHTGLPEISIPIYTINSGKISIPLSLSYHAQGIRVDEIASRYGLGWNLIGVGAITREVKDKIDEFNYLKPSSDGYYNFIGLTEDPQRLADYFDGYGNNFEKIIDFEPDIFTFNILGYSGKFFFDQATKEPILQSFDDIKIEVVGLTGQDSEIHGFILTDPQGTKYYFGRNSDNTVNNLEKSEQVNTNFYQFNIDDDSNTSPGYYTGGSFGSLATIKWNLLEIKDIYGNTVTFEYDFEQLNHKKRLFDGLLNPLEFTSEKRLVSMYGQVSGTQWFLRKVNFKEGEVEFIPASEPREDMGQALNLHALSPKYIEQIQVKNYQNEVIKAFHLDYEYVENNDVSNTLVTYHNEPKKRLFLKSVQQFTQNNDSLPPYHFIYNDVLLPNRFSNSIDWWGFYNGKQNGDTYDLWAMPSDLTFQMNYLYNGGREIDVEKSQAGLLQKVIYPTGGYAEYEYEPNECLTPWFMKNTVNLFRNPSEMKGTDFHESDTFKVSPPGAPWYQEVYETPQFTINKNALSPSGKNTVYFNGTNQGGFSMEAGGTPVDEPFHIQLICDELFSGATPPAAISFAGLVNINSIRQLEAGKYRLRATRIEEKVPSSLPDFSLAVSWREESVSAGNQMFIGGNRIKKIMLKDEEENKVIKRYEYTFFGSNQSSGMLFGFPEIYVGVDTSIGDFGVGLSINSLHPTPLFHAGYSHVTEYTEGEGTEQKVEYMFTANPNEGKFFNYPLIPQTEYDWIRGKPLSVKYYKTNSNNSFSLQKEVITDYNYPWFLSLEWIDPNYIDRALFPTAQTTPVSHNNDKKSYFLNIPRRATENGGGIKYYIISGGHISTKSVTEKNYFGGDIITEMQELKNDSPAHFQLTELKSHNSDGTVFTTEYFYPGDTAVASEPYEEELALANIIAPLVTKTKKGSDNLSTTKTQYNTLLSPELIKTSKGSASLEDRIRYMQYDDKGNPLEVKQENGISIVYLWGYNQAYPIAKIENATYDEVVAALGTTTISEANLSAINALRTNSAFANAMITTYTYKPLVGVTSITDPRGYTTTYHYDNFNRLEFVKDAAGNILERTQYHYQN